MIQQGLVPGMEQCDETDLSAQARVAKVRFNLGFLKTARQDNYQGGQLNPERYPGNVRMVGRYLVCDWGIQTNKNDRSLGVYFPLEVPELAVRDLLPLVSLFSARDLFRASPALRKPTWQNKESTP